MLVFPGEVCCWLDSVETDEVLELNKLSPTKLSASEAILGLTTVLDVDMAAIPEYLTLQNSIGICQSRVTGHTGKATDRNLFLK